MDERKRTEPTNKMAGNQTANSNAVFRLKNEPITKLHVIANKNQYHSNVRIRLNQSQHSIVIANKITVLYYKKLMFKALFSSCDTTDDGITPESTFVKSN